MPTKIEWAKETWNPVTGCTPISPGCDHCYAKRMATRLKGRHGYPADEPFRVTFHPDRLDEPLRWRKSRRIFVCSMSDLFHNDLEDWQRDEIFAVIMGCSFFDNFDHTFLILTKRPDNMSRYLSGDPATLLERWGRAGRGWIIPDDDEYFDVDVGNFCGGLWAENGTLISDFKPWSHPENLFPLPNLWLGVTAENQEMADRRIPILLDVPAAVRFVSIEPMLGPVDVSPYFKPWLCDGCGQRLPPGQFAHEVFTDETRLHHAECGRGFWGAGLDWVILGGETGPGARPLHPDWARSVRDQCAAAGVPFFFKQWGEYSWERLMTQHAGNVTSNSLQPIKVGKKQAGRLLDGRTHDEYPLAPNT